LITIKSRVRKIKIDSRKLKSNIAKMLKIAGYPDFDIGLLLTTNRTIRAYNKKYRKKDKPTDILSFPFHGDLKAGQKITISSSDDKNLGDIIISLEYAEDDARAQSRSLMEHVTMLLAHGIAHLLGYEHKTDRQHRKMLIKEKQLTEAVRPDSVHPE